MKVVLDTNVVVSGLLTRGGTCSRILQLILDDRLECFLDDRIFVEYKDVCLHRGLPIDQEAADDFFRHVETLFQWVTSRPLAVALPDPDDLPFLEVAHESGALLVTGNTKHFQKNLVRGIPVVTPAQLLERLRKG